MEEIKPTSEGAAPPRRTPIEELSKEELLGKYKILMNVAKKAKLAKDDIYEENCRLKEALARCETQKEADKNALITMKEMVDQFTESKLQLTTQLSEQQRAFKQQQEKLQQLGIENESLKRQLGSLTEENEGLLQDIDAMEAQLKQQVDLIGMEQKQHLAALELQVNKLKEAELLNSTLQQQLAASCAENKALKEQQNLANQQLEQLKQKHAQIKHINSEQCAKFKQLKMRFIDLYRKVKQLKDCKRVLLETQQEYAEAVNKWQLEISAAAGSLCQELNELRQQNECLLLQQKQLCPQDLLSHMLQQLNNLQQLVEKAELEQQQHEQLISALEKENQALRQLHSETALLSPAADEPDHETEILKLKQEFVELSCNLSSNTQSLERLQTENDKLLEQLNYKSNSAGDFNKISEEVVALQLQNEELVQHMRSLENLNMENVERLNELTHENAELREKMSEFNELLPENEQLRLQIEQFKQQVEAIQNSKDNLQRQLQRQQEENDKALNEHEQANKSARAQAEDQEEKLRLQTRDQQHELINEMRELNEELKVRGDTISRLQDNELKINSQLEQVEQQLQIQSETIKQKESQLEEFKHIMEKALESTKTWEEERVVLLAKLTKLEEDARNSELSKAGKAEKAKQEEMLNTTQRAELEETKSKLKEVQQRLQEAEQKLKTKQQEFDLERQELKKLKSARKQTNMLNLEIDAAEKSLKEATLKLTQKISEVQLLNEAVDAKERIIEQLRKEVALLEEAKKSECVHAQELKAQVDRLQAQLKDLVHGKQLDLDRYKELEQAHEAHKLKYEECLTQLASIGSQHEAALMKARAEKQKAESELLQLQQENTHNLGQLRTMKRELEDLRVEYLDYKVKAQAVLRKNQHKDTTKEREQDEELLELQAKEKLLEAELAKSVKQLEQQNSEHALLKEDYENLEQRSRDLQRLIDDLKQQNDELALEQRQQMQEQQETLVRHRQQIDNLNACHKQQLQSLEENFQRRIAELEAAQQQTTMRSNYLLGAAPSSNSFMPIVPICQQTNESKLDLLLLEREDAEGSEEATETLAGLSASRKNSSNSQNRRNQHDFMPLEELLSAPMQSLNSETINYFDAQHAADESMLLEHTKSAHLELQATKERLQQQETQVRHLTALLSENEQDLAKLTQMNDMLKEELRRQERGVEREKHMHNSEYLKNVIVKFLTLNNGDERTRLVPVLNTILKLSRSETEMLNSVAKGQKVNSNSGGWGSFLPSWSSNNNN